MSGKTFCWCCVAGALLMYNTTGRGDGLYTIGLSITMFVIGYYAHSVEYGEGRYPHI